VRLYREEAHYQPARKRPDTEEVESASSAGELRRIRCVRWLIREMPVKLTGVQARFS